MKYIPITLLLMLAMDSLGSDQGFMDRYFESKIGKLVNVSSPCDPGCYVEIDIDGDLFSTTTSGIHWEKLYDLKDEKDNSVTLNYSLNNGSYLVHTSTNTKFLLNGTMDKHPIDYALENCYSSAMGQTTIGMSMCLEGAEQAWDDQLNITYEQRGGSSNEPLRNAQLAWIKFRDAQFDWFISHFGSKQGSKWGAVIQERKITVIRQQVELLQSAYLGY